MRSPTRGSGSAVLLIVDADVLIDYVGADLSMLGTVSRNVGQVHIAGVVLQEVDGLDANACAAHDLVVVEAGHLVLNEAAARRGQLSFEDWVSLLLAKENGWTCVTNDKALRRTCADADVDVRWGLEVMLDLLKIDAALHDDVVSVATAIHERNRTHITADILAKFVTRAGRTRRRR